MVQKKSSKKKWDYPIGLEKMSKQEADAIMDDYFSKLEDQLKDVPEAELKKGSQKIIDYLEGKIGWAELFNFTPEMLFQMAEFGYNQFKFGRYEDAERVFKVLTVLDWNNHYYHSMMGTILQRQKRYGEAMAEYAQAIELFPQDTVSLTNRGEIFMMHNLITEAKADFEQAIATDPTGEDKWANRARVLLLQIEKSKKKGDKKPTKKEH
ncbi:MAG: tetratricopeptide repeat protein [Pseudomonadota bacterium]